MNCPTHKQGYDKKGAQTFANLTFKLHHIKSNIYECKVCKRWHLTTITKNKKGTFRHNI